MKKAEFIENAAAIIVMAGLASIMGIGMYGILYLIFRAMREAFVQ